MKGRNDQPTRMGRRLCTAVAALLLAITAAGQADATAWLKSVLK